MMFYTKEQVDQFTLEQAREALNVLTQEYNLEKPITECWQAVWPVLDEIINTLLYLEDRIYYVETCDRLDAARPTKEKRALAAEQEEEFKTNYG
jgi:division protein CdvB (Snf7/Vps24/ESCRT-III family)